MPMQKRQSSHGREDKSEDMGRNKILPKLRSKDGRRKEGAGMKITIEISDNAICGFLNLVEFTGIGMQMVSFQLGSDDLVDGKTTKLPREKGSKEE